MECNNYSVSRSSFSSASCECARAGGGQRLGSLTLALSFSLSLSEVLIAPRWVPHLGFCLPLLEAIEGALVCAGGLGRQKRQGVFSKETHLEPALNVDDSGPLGTVPLLLAIMTHGGTLTAFAETSRPPCEILVLVYLL